MTLAVSLPACTAMAWGRHSQLLPTRASCESQPPEHVGRPITHGWGHPHPGPLEQAGDSPDAVIEPQNELGWVGLCWVGLGWVGRDFQGHPIHPLPAMGRDIPTCHGQGHLPLQQVAQSPASRGMVPGMGHPQPLNLGNLGRVSPPLTVKNGCG